MFFVNRKSYGYDIQTPLSEPKKDDKKYKFDYTLEMPAEEKPIETEPRTLYTKVDRITQDKPGEIETNLFSRNIFKYVQKWIKNNSFCRVLV